MHHVVLERWSRRRSPIHARDPRVKVLATLVFLVAVATTPSVLPLQVAGYAAFLLAGVLMARLPLGGVLLRACVVLPFTGTFALVSLLAGDADRALALVVKSYLSAFAALLLVGTTPLPRLLNGLERLRAPRMVVLVVQFLYRYLFVISEQGQHMRQAAQCRGGFRKGRVEGFSSQRSRFRAAAGALAVLFGRSYQRAEGIHRAMLSRGFLGRLNPLSVPELHWTDVVFLLLAAAIPLAVRLGAGAQL